jgi:hypothetical protein
VTRGTKGKLEGYNIGLKERHTSMVCMLDITKMAESPPPPPKIIQLPYGYSNSAGVSHLQPIVSKNFTRLPYILQTISEAQHHYKPSCSWAHNSSSNQKHHCLPLQCQCSTCRPCSQPGQGTDPVSCLCMQCADQRSCTQRYNWWHMLPQSAEDCTTAAWRREMPTNSNHCS